MKPKPTQFKPVKAWAAFLDGSFVGAYPTEDDAASECGRIFHRRIPVLITPIPSEPKPTDLEQANGLLRSAFSIALRRGKETNWDAFTKRLKEELDREHKIMYPSKLKAGKTKSATSRR